MFEALVSSTEWIHRTVSEQLPGQYNVTIFISLVCAVSYFTGKAMHSRRFAHVLAHINDDQLAKSQITTEQRNLQNKLSRTRHTLKKAKYALTVLMICLIVMFYLSVFSLWAVLTLGLSGLFIWLLLLLRCKYMQMRQRQITQQITSSALSADAEIKQIIDHLGQEICKLLKERLQASLQAQKQVQSKQQCRLMRCYDEKKTGEQLYELGKTIIHEMQQLSWCDICSSRSNANASELRLQELQNRMGQCKRAAEEKRKLTTQKRKQLTNRLLVEWQALSSRLPFLCKRGCCIRFREHLEAIKNKYFRRLNDFKKQLLLLAANK